MRFERAWRFVRQRIVCGQESIDAEQEGTDGYVRTKEQECDTEETEYEIGKTAILSAGAGMEV